MHRLLLVAAAASSAAARYPHEAWMGDNWAVLQGKTLLQVTLPGSHNSGNTAELLGTGPRCAADDSHYTHYRTWAAQQHGAVPLPRGAFDDAFLPWNINHDRNISTQLSLGIRFFHLKLCWVDDSGPLRLSAVRHQHRGFTAATAEAIVRDMASFLIAHPRESVVIGLNNLNGFDAAAKVQLARLIVDAFGEAEIGAVGPASLRTSTLAELGAATPPARVVVFMGGGVAQSQLPSGVCASASTMIENWNDEMESGNPEDAAEWLAEDVAQNADQSALAPAQRRFFVMQANPNNAMNNMFEQVQVAAAAAASGGGNDGGGPFSLLEWERGFLLGLGELVRTSLDPSGKNPNATINGISTDFLELAEVTRLALFVGGLLPAPEPLHSRYGATPNDLAIFMINFRTLALAGVG